MPDQRKLLCIQMIRDREEVRGVLDPSVRPDLGNVAPTASTQVQRHKLDPHGCQPLAEELKALQIRRQAGDAEHEWCIPGPVPLGVEPPRLQLDVEFRRHAANGVIADSPPLRKKDHPSCPLRNQPLHGDQELLRHVVRISFQR
jgi:hypothetical protein